MSCRISCAGVNLKDDGEILDAYCYVSALVGLLEGCRRVDVCRTGELLYALGIICAVQGRMLESFNYFRGGRRQLERASGTVFHWNVAKIRYKSAGHYIQKHDWNPA